MEVRLIFSILAFLFGSVSFIPYIISIVRNKTKPMKVTWLIWANLDSITFLGMYTKNSLNGEIVGVVVGSWITFFISLKYGISDWTKLDKLCLVGAIISMLLWQIFDDPLLGILISLFASCIGCLPMFVSIWEDSRNEDKLAWVMGTFASLCAIASIPTWTMEHYAQPVGFLLIQGVILYLLFIRAAKPVKHVSHSRC